MLDNMPRGTICIEDLEIGRTRTLRKVVTDRDIELFAEVSTDRNPVHLDDAYAQDTIFQGRIAHGMLTAGLMARVVKDWFGPEAMRKFNVRFAKQVWPGETLTFTAVVTAVHPEGLVDLEL